MRIVSARFAVICVLGLSSVARPAVAADAVSDWPTVQHDMCRTGCTPVCPKPGEARFRWVFADGKTFKGGDLLKTDSLSNAMKVLPGFTSARFSPLCQPTARGGVMYVGSIEGEVFAVDVKTGDLKWRKKASGQVLHTVTVGDEAVYVAAIGGLDAFKLADGEKLWTFRPAYEPVSFWVCPALSRGIVMVGSLEGNFYGVDAKTGAQKWKYEVGLPIYHSGACDDDTVYFGAEDMHIYALNVADGKLKWKSPQLAGTTFGHYWPVISKTQGVLAVRTSSRFGCIEPHHGSPEDYQQTQEFMREYYKKHPDRDCFFVLNLADGKDKVPVATGQFAFHGDLACPPIVREGKLWAHHNSKFGAFQGKSGFFGFGNTTDFAPLNLETGFFERIGPNGSFAHPAINRQDDHYVISVGGDYIWGCEGGYGGGGVPLKQGIPKEHFRLSAFGATCHLEDDRRTGVVGFGRHWTGGVCAAILEDCLLYNPMGACIVCLEGQQ